MGLVTIIIPARNEEENIVPTVEAIGKTFDRHGIAHEIVVVNDGSTDRTEEFVKNMSGRDERVRLVRNTDRNGIGYAIRKGLQKFKGDYVIIAMADASDDPEDMVRYVQEVRKGYDCCFGNRWERTVTVEGYPPLKYMLNRVVNALINLLFGLHYKDLTNAFKCYSRETIQGVQPILSRHFNITVELPLKAVTRGFSYTVVPTHWYSRKKGKTHLFLKEMGSRYFFIVMYIFLEKLLCGEDYKKIQRSSVQSPDH